MTRRKRSPEENERRAKIRELLLSSNISMVEKRRYRSDRYRLIPVSAVYTRGERLHKIRDRPVPCLVQTLFCQTCKRICA